MTLIPLWAKAMIVLALLAAVMFAVHRLDLSRQEIGYQKAVAEYNVKLIEAQTAATAKTKELTDKLETAQNEATKRQNADAARIATLTATAGGLRNTVATLRNSLSTASLDACRTTASALAVVFGECQSEVERLGQAAQGHFNDSLMYQEAWPK
jgi:hypothetical protein